MTSPRCYSAAFTDDVHQAVCELRCRFPGAPLLSAGYSLGAVILTKYLSEADSGHWPGEGTLTTALCFCVLHKQQRACSRTGMSSRCIF